MAMQGLNCNFGWSGKDNEGLGKKGEKETIFDSHLYP